MTTRQMTLSAMLTALLCILGPLTLPLGPLPLSLTAAALMLTALLLGPGRSCLCCTLYLLLGLMGMPVFAGFTGGAGAFLGPTGGFLLAYLPACWLWGIFLPAQSRLRQLTGCILGMLLLYLCGTCWYMVTAGVSAPQALSVCVLPFLPGDGLKIAFLLTAGNRIRGRIGALAG